MDGRVELALVADDAGNDLAEEGRIGIAILVAVDLLAEPIGLELGEHLRQRRAGKLHLIERLHGRKPRRTALVGRLGVAAHGYPGKLLAERDHRERRLGRGAALVEVADARADPGLVVVLDRQDAVSDREPMGHGEVHDGASRFAGDDVEVEGLAADDTAEKDEAVVAGAALPVCRDRHCQRRRNLEATRHADALMAGMGALECLRRALEELVGKIVIEARFDDQEMRRCHVASHAAGRAAVQAASVRRAT